MAIVRLENVTKVYPLGKTEVHAVQGISLEIERGDFISIAGPSGSGKTTILNLIGCIDTPSRGSVQVDGRATESLRDGEITALRRSALGFIFQSFNLIPVLNVFENIEFPLLLGRSRIPARKQWIDSLIESVGLEKWRTHRPNELSGGQRQRVAIARALVTRPQIVLADEPTANLDSATAEEIIGLMKRFNREQGTTFIFSTHDERIVAIADHVIHVQDGKVVSESRREGKHASAR